MADDPFPRDRVATLLRRFPAYLRLSWRLAREPLLSRARRAAVIGAAGYLASPVDLVPGVIPVLGQLDDIAVALAAIRIALAGLSPERRRFHLDAVGLADADLAADLRTTAVATAWVLRAGARASVRAAKVGGRAAVAGGRAAAAGAGLAARSSSVMAKKSAGAARSASGAARSASGAAVSRIPRRRVRDLSAETLAVDQEGDRARRQDWPSRTAGSSRAPRADAACVAALNARSGRATSFRARRGPVERAPARSGATSRCAGRGPVEVPAALACDLVGDDPVVHHGGDLLFSDREGRSRRGCRSRRRWRSLRRGRRGRACPGR